MEKKYEFDLTFPEGISVQEGIKIGQAINLALDLLAIRQEKDDVLKFNTEQFIDYISPIVFETTLPLIYTIRSRYLELKHKELQKGKEKEVQNLANDLDKFL